MVGDNMMKWRRRCNHCNKVVVCGDVHLARGLIIQDKECPECHGELDIFDVGHMRIETRKKEGL